MASIKQRCVTQIKKQMGDKMTREEIAAVVDGLDDLAQARPKLGMQEARRLKLLARELTEADIFAAKMEKRQRAINIARFRQGRERLDAGGVRNLDKTLTSMTVGRVDGTVKSADSVDATAINMHNRWLGGMLADAQAKGVTHRMIGSGLFRRVDNNFDLLVRTEMRRLKGAPEQPTGNAEALAVAEIYNKYLEARRVGENQAGAYIGSREDFDVTQTHDPLKVSRAAEILGGTYPKGMGRIDRVNISREAWVRWISPRLSEETFVGVTDRNKFLRTIFDNLATGNHLGEDASRNFNGDFSFIGPGNLAKRLSQGRVLHFLDAKAAWEYETRFGTGSLFDNVAYSLERGARNIATMQVFGVNPEAMFDRLVQYSITKAKAEGDLKLVDRLETGNDRKGLLPTLKAQFRSATGISETPGNPTVARRLAAVRAVTSMMRLGGMVLSSFPDLAVRASILRRNGVSLLGASTDGLASLAKGRGSLERQRALGFLGIGFEGMRGAALARFSAADNVPGRLSKGMNTFFRLNLSSWWQDSLMQGAGEMMAKNLANHAGMKFDALPNSLRSIMRSYGIEAADWDTFRTSGKRTVDGEEWLIGEAVEDKEVARKFGLYYTDQSRMTMTMGGAAERAWVENFGPPGSAGGELARFILQFKNYPLTFARRQFVGGIQQGNYMGVAQMIVMTTVLGYASMAVKDMLKGKEPRDPTAASTWAAALTQGGGLGIYGDFLLGEYDRYGRTVGEALAGPTVSVVSGWARVLNQIAQAGFSEKIDFEDAGADAYKQALNSLPYANLFYARIALDYLVLWNIQEMLDPGSLKRMEQRQANDTGQGYWLSPTHALGVGR